MNWFKRLFNKCDHEYEFVRNIYGDQINYCNGKRSIWKCKKCGKIEYRDELELSLCGKLDKFYKDYYKNKYEQWKLSKKEILDDIVQNMIEYSKQGKCWYDIILICNKSFDDKYYYEKWIEENNLKVNITLLSEDECTELNKYNFSIRWNYK